MIDSIIVWGYIVPAAFILGNLWFSLKMSHITKELFDKQGIKYDKTPTKGLSTVVYALIPLVNLLILWVMLAGNVSLPDQSSPEQSAQ